MRNYLASVIVITFFTLAGCLSSGGGSTPATPNVPAPPTLVNISISTINTQIPYGKSVVLSATGTYSDNSTSDLSRQVSWTSSNTSVGTIASTTSILSGIGLGSTNITASLNSITSSTLALSVIFPPPIGLFAVSGNNQVTLSWAPVTGATSYNIYWGTSAGITTASTKISNVTSPYLQTGLSTGVTYYYRISAQNSTTESLSNELFSFTYTGGNPAGSFTSNISAHVARAGHTATLLQNGTVLIAGGQSGSSNVNTAEIYDPVANTFTLVGNMNAARYMPTATLLPNGKVLIAGASNTQITADRFSAELYDPTTQTFSITGSMFVGRDYPVATLLPTGKVLISGGTQSLDAAELYDPSAGTFTKTGIPTFSRLYHSATLLTNGKVLLTGGYGSNNPTVTNSAPISIAELYDPYTGAFAQAGSLNQSRYFHNSTLLPNGQVLIMAGLNSATGFLNSSELYDPTTSTFSSIAGVLNNIGVYDFQSTLLPDGKILVTGGVGPSYFGGVVNTSYIFDPSNNSITTTGNMTSARALHSSTFLPNGKVLVFGGGSNLATSEVFQ